MRVRRAVAVEVISIHALREEGDGGRGLVDLRLFDFYPRPPRGGRPVVFSALPALAEFLSTPSARRATPLGIFVAKFVDNFYPRPPRGGRPITLSRLWL